MNPVPGFNITTSYGKRGSHWSCNKKDGLGVHTGVDIAAPLGTDVVAARPGIVRRVNFGNAFGNHQIEIFNEDGSSDFYAHMQHSAANKLHVDAGMWVGNVGEEGNVTGPHLHFERHKLPSFWSCTNHVDPAPSLTWEPPTPPLKLKFAHISMQHSDSPEEVLDDLTAIGKKLNSQGVLVVTGTEAGGKKSPLLYLLHRVLSTYDFTVYSPPGTDGWIAVSRKAADPSAIRFDSIPVIPPNTSGRHTGRNIVTAEFAYADEAIAVMTTHYLVRGAAKGQVNFVLNTGLSRAVGDAARRLGKGSAIVLYGGDQNSDDRVNDTFHGEPLTSLRDELGRHNESRREIDVLATYNQDRRVSAKAVWSLHDSDFRLNTDHPLVIGSVLVQPRS